LKQTVLEGCS